MTRQDIKETNLSTGSGHFTTFPGGYTLVTFKEGFQVLVDHYGGISYGGACYDDKDILHFKNDIIKTFIEDNKVGSDYYFVDFEVGHELFSSNGYVSMITKNRSWFDKDTRYNGDLHEFLQNNKNKFSIQLEIHWKAFNDDSVFIKENQQFVDGFKADFMGAETEILSAVFKTEYYQCGYIKDVLETRKGGRYSSKNINIYNFIYTHSFVRAEYEYRDQECIENEMKRIEEAKTEENNESFISYPEQRLTEYNHWINEYLYENSIEIEDGLYVSSLTPNLIFSSAEDLIFEKADVGQRHSEEFDKIVNFFNSESPNPYLSSANVEFFDFDKQKNKRENITATIVSPLYFVDPTMETIVNTDISESEGMAVKIDKNRFMNGILKKGYTVVIPYHSSGGDARLPKFYDIYFEDENILFFERGNLSPFAVVKK